MAERLARACPRCPSTALECVDYVALIYVCQSCGWIGAESRLADVVAEEGPGLDAPDETPKTEVQS